jgi:hypothetical protein
MALLEEIYNIYNIYWMDASLLDDLTTLSLLHFLVKEATSEPTTPTRCLKPKPLTLNPNP